MNTHDPNARAKASAALVMENYRLRREHAQMVAATRQVRYFRVVASDARADVRWLQSRVRLWKELTVIVGLCGIALLVAVLAYILAHQP